MQHNLTHLGDCVYFFHCSVELAEVVSPSDALSASRHELKQRSVRASGSVGDPVNLDLCHTIGTPKVKCFFPFVHRLRMDTHDALSL